VADQTADEASEAARAHGPPFPQCLSDVCASPRLGGILALHLFDLMKHELELLLKHFALLAAGRPWNIVRLSLPGSTSRGRARMYG
jgi:hypothetical protein